MDAAVLAALREHFQDRLQEKVLLAGYTSARIGGPADALIIARKMEELSEAAGWLWQENIPFLLLGGGSNVLVSDQGIRSVVLLNRVRSVRFNAQAPQPTVHAESGATLNDIAQRAARLGLSGLEWAASIPGSLGGAVYGNAGAFGGDMAGNVISVDILKPIGRETWPVEAMNYGYRTSQLKRERPILIVLGATLKLHHGQVETIRVKMAENADQRRRTQPPGASLGSMFKNPNGDQAGHLLEAAGLKGARIGSAEISRVHANFFINTEQTRAADMRALMELAQQAVYAKFGIRLEPEIEMIGEWD
jgi:UDP-N-acetylmuramate dehydrogenase